MRTARLFILMGITLIVACGITPVPTIVEITHTDGTTEEVTFNKTGKLKLEKDQLVMGCGCGPDSVVAKDVTEFKESKPTE